MSAVSATPIVTLSEYSESAPSICIPRVFSNISWGRVKGIFEKLGLGEVDRVDMVNKKNEKGESYKRVFVHFKKWATTDEARQCREKLISGDQVKIVYDEPWYWKISASNVARPERTTTTVRSVSNKGNKKNVTGKTHSGPRVKLDLKQKGKSSVVSKGKGGSKGGPPVKKGGDVLPGASVVDLLRMQLTRQRREIEELKAMMGVGSSTTKMPTLSINLPKDDVTDDVVASGGITPPYAPQSPVFRPPSPPYAPQSHVFRPPSPVLKPPSPVLKPQTPLTPPYAPQSPVYQPETQTL